MPSAAAESTPNQDIIAAREKIVEGAVTVVEGALQCLEANDIVTFG